MATSYSATTKPSATSYSNVSKPSVSYTGQDKTTLGLTWTEAVYTWAEALFTWGDTTGTVWLNSTKP